MLAPRRIHKLFILFHLRTDFVQLAHELNSLPTDFNNMIVLARDVHGELIIVGDCFLDICRHSFLLFMLKAENLNELELFTYHADDSALEHIYQFTELAFPI